MNNTVETDPLICSECGCGIEVCQFCDEEGCPRAICFTCVVVAVGQEIRQPHEHGG